MKYYDPTDDTFQDVEGSGGAPKVQVTGSTALNYEEVTVDNTAGGVALTAAKYAGAARAVIIVKTAPINYRVDGKAAPTATSGMPADDRDTIELTSNAEIVAFRAIRTGSVSAVLHVTYSS